jgi:hypothetical protein
MSSETGVRPLSHQFVTRVASPIYAGSTSCSAGTMLGASTLFEANSDPSRGSPRYTTCPLHTIFADNQFKIIGYADWTFYFETGACLRNIFHHAINAASASKRNRSSLQRALALTFPLFVHESGPSGSANPKSRLNIASAYVT